METSYRAVSCRRVSMHGPVDGFSLDAQVTHIQIFVKAQGWQQMEFYAYTTVSTKKASQRPALEQLLMKAFRIAGFTHITFINARGQVRSGGRRQDRPLLSPPGAR